MKQIRTHAVSVYLTRCPGILSSQIAALDYSPQRAGFTLWRPHPVIVTIMTDPVLNVWRSPVVRHDTSPLSNSFVYEPVKQIVM